MYIRTCDFVWEDGVQDFPLFLLVFSTHACDVCVGAMLKANNQELMELLVVHLLQLKVRCSIEYNIFDMLLGEGSVK